MLYFLLITNGTKLILTFIQLRYYIVWGNLNLCTLFILLAEVIPPFQILNISHPLAVLNNKMNTNYPFITLTCSFIFNTEYVNPRSGR